MCSTRKYLYFPHRREFPVGREFSKSKKFKKWIKLNLNFQRGGVGVLEKSLPWGRYGLDIFWNYTISHLAKFTHSGDLFYSKS